MKRAIDSSAHVLTPNDLGQANRFRVLQALVDSGPLSRAELARLLGAPRASVGVITNGLIDDGILTEEELAQPAAGRGKPAKPLWFAESAGLSGAISIEPDRVSSGLVDARGRLSGRQSRHITPDVSAEKLTEIVVELARETFEHTLDLTGIGLVVPAQCDSMGGRIELCTIIPSLTESRLPSVLAETLGRDTILEQDVRALASAERWFGAGRGAERFAVVQVDRGVGVGLVIDGHVFPGPQISSPQFGHTIVDRSGAQCTCGSRGCWETIASLDWLLREASRRGLSRDDITQIIASAEGGAEAALEVLAEFADNLAIGMANLLHVFRVPKLVLHGSAARLGEGFHTILDERVQAHMGSLARNVEITASTLGDEALLLGAGATSMSRRLGVRL